MAFFSSITNDLHRQIIASFSFSLSPTHTWPHSAQAKVTKTLSWPSNLGKEVIWLGIDLSQGWSHSSRGILLSTLVGWGRPGGIFQRKPKSPGGKGRKGRKVQSEAGLTPPALLRDPGQLVISSLSFPRPVMMTTALPPILCHREE